MDSASYTGGGLILFLVSLGRFWEVLGALRLSRRLRRHGVRVDAEVVEVRAHEAEDLTAKQLVVEFVDEGGKTWTIRSRMAAIAYANATGRRVTVTYLREDPRKARIDCDARRVWVLNLVVGIVLAGVAVGLLVYGNQIEMRPQS